MTARPASQGSELCRKLDAHGARADGGSGGADDDGIQALVVVHGRASRPHPRVRARARTRSRRRRCARRQLQERRSCYLGCDRPAACDGPGCTDAMPRRGTWTASRRLDRFNYDYLDAELERDRRACNGARPTRSAKSRHLQPPNVLPDLVGSCHGTASATTITSSNISNSLTAPAP